MASRFILPFSAGAMIGSTLLWYYNNPRTLHKRWDWDWDGRHSYFLEYLSNGQKQDPVTYPNGQRTLTLIRHSQYHRTQGDINDNKPLTELGKIQAKVTGERLNELNMKFDKIYTSKFVRGQETCKIIVNELENNDVSDIIYDSDLNEGLATIIEPFTNYRTKEDYMDVVKKTAPAIRNGFTKYFHRRDKKDMNPLNEKNREDILIVGHANVFRYYLNKCLQFEEFGWARYSLHNCSVSRIYIYDDGRVKVTHIGDTGHLPPNLLTNNLTELSM
eukprot:278147_1